ncbi:MAG TPA: PAS domain-containing sensor histidine kinase [Bacteriovoracaceae bacterium]|nr:PAS domain-containing sensor histidine kinase [Bacteriovoracaceae bacterium]
MPDQPNFNTHSWRELLVETSLDAVVAMDSDNLVVDWNVQAEKIFGYTKEEALGNDISLLIIPPAFREAHRQGTLKYLATGIGPVLNKRIELEALHSSGKTIQIELTVAPIRQEGKILFYSFVRDITDRLNKDRAKEIQRKQLKDMFMDAPSAISILRGPGHVFELANRSYLNFIDKTEEEILGRPLSEILTDDFHTSFKKNLEEVYRTGRVFFANEYPTRIDQDPLQAVRYFNIVVQPLYENNQVDGIISFGNDVTNAVLARKAAEEAVRSRDEFISICSHELKTPVTSMKLQFQMASRQIDKGDERAFSRSAVERRVNTTNQQLDRMAKLIEDMLDVSKLSAGKILMESKEVEVNQLVEDVFERFIEQFESMQIPVDLKTSPEKIHVLGDRFRLEQVLSNLLNNAIKYGEAKPVEISVTATDRAVKISVQDQGMGIAPENLGRIFQRYERAISSANISGLGLGLYISHQIVEAHQGKIEVTSFNRKGSNFTVELPRI